MLRKLISTLTIPFKSKSQEEKEEHLIFTLRGQDPELQQRLNNAIQKLRQNGLDVIVFSKETRTGLLKSLQRNPMQEGKYTIVV